MADPMMWPANANSRLVDTDPQWRHVPLIVWEDANIDRFAQVSRSSLNDLLKIAPSLPIPDRLLNQIRKLCDGVPLEEVKSGASVTPYIEKVSSLSEREFQIERLRSGIPVEILLQRLLTIAITGTATDGQQANVREQLDAAKYCIGKILPDAKTVDRQSINRDVDRKQRIKDRTVSQDEMRQMTAQELEDELARVERELKARETASGSSESIDD